jgi:hypothetical protein
MARTNLLRGPQLTGSADIKLNERVSLRRPVHALSTLHRIISPKVRAHTGKAVRRYIPLGGFVFLKVVSYDHRRAQRY